MDLTEAEWLAKRTGGLPYYDNTTVFLDTLNEEVLFKMSQVKKTPRDFNWVDQGGVSSVKNQAQCGSCAAFAAVGAIESCTKITVGNMADDLSEQHLLDCAYNHVFTDGSGSWGCYGCDGAWPQGYIDWIVPTTTFSLMAVAPGDVMAVMELGPKDILTGSLMSALTTRRNLPTPTPPGALVMSPLADLPAAATTRTSK